MRHVPLLFAFALAAAVPSQEQATAYVGARILPGGAPAIEDGVFVVAGGKVVAIGGKSTGIPDGARTIDCNGRTITPGLIDASFAGGEVPTQSVG